MDNVKFTYRKMFVVLVDQYSRESMISCTICEKQRIQTPYMHAFKFEFVKAAVGWFESMIKRKSFVSRELVNSCPHVIIEWQRHKDYPVVMGRVIEEEDEEIDLLPIVKR